MDFKNKDFNTLMSKALKKYDREEVFFSNVSQDTVNRICKTIDTIVKFGTYSMSNNIVICGFRMTDNRCEPIFNELEPKFRKNEEDIDSMSLYTLVAMYLHEKTVPNITNVHKYILADAISGSGDLFYNMSYV